MDRKEFVKKLSLSTLAAPLLAQYGNDDPNSGSGACDLTDSATAGPFPTRSPATLGIADIRSDRQGVQLNINITIKDRSNKCLPLAGALVDIWHCDKEGDYSEYGGTGLQSTNHTSAHFLRGRQATDAKGTAQFVSIYPGWYPGRAPHIHVHVYDAAGATLLISQIGFPDNISTHIYTNSSLYSSRGTHDTTNRDDNILDDTLNTTLAEVTGDVNSGFTLNHEIIVS